MNRWRCNIQSEQGKRYYCLVDTSSEGAAKEYVGRVMLLPGDRIVSVEGPFRSKDDRRAANR